MQTRSTIVDIKKLEIPVQEFKTPKQIFVKVIKLFSDTTSFI